MDEENKAVNTNEVAPVTESPAVEQSQTVESEAPSEGSQGAEQSVEQPKKVSGAEKRIHEVVDQRDAARQEAETLRAKIAELTNNWQYAPTQNESYSQNTPAESESSGEERTLTEADLDRRIAQKATTIAQLIVERDKTVNRINQESELALKSYPQLDPSNKEQYDPELNSVITEAVYLKVKENPTLSVTKLVDTYMKPYLKSVEKAVEEKKQEITQTVTSAALRPSQTPAKSEKSIEEMSVAEIEAKYGTVR